MEEFYGKTDIERFTKFLIMVCEIFGVGRIKIDEKTGTLQFIYENWLDEEMAKRLQTAMGKVPVGVAKTAKNYNCKVIAFAGSVTEEAKKRRIFKIWNRRLSNKYKRI